MLGVPNISHAPVARGKEYLGNKNVHAASRVDIFPVAREGFEPPKAEPADLQSAPVGRLGIEPGR